jgi:hypothetical protein
MNKIIIIYFWVILQIHFFPSNKKHKFVINPKKKIITVRRGCWSTQKIAKNWMRRLKNTKIKI